MGLSPAVRQALGERIIAALQPFVTERPGVLGAYWPFRAEFDPQPLIESLVAAGRVVVLSVVIDKHGPLEYRTWRPGENLISGVWDIPISEKREIVITAMVLAPLSASIAVPIGLVMAAATSIARSRP
jgi:5-formyltetrahydrofolate cyclo-ligase